MQILNAFTVDVEDYYQVSAFEQHVRRDQWDRWESRVVANTQRILELLERHDVKGTFFVLGWVAERYPTLVREIHARGHELGSHGYWHRLIYEQSPGEFREDLRRSRNVLEDAVGAGVTAHRAASFSITARSLWALEILVEEGFRVDSSIFPIRHDRYGIADAEPRLHRVKTRAGPLWEFPPSVARIARMNLPVSGGGYFRLYPLRLTSYCLRRINRARQPFIFYVHPWELDPGQPRIPVPSRLSRFRHYVGLGRNRRKLDRLLAEFRFGRVSDVLEDRQRSLAGCPDTTPCSSPRHRADAAY
ncbi:MAG: XrtA system polysaccharide deacetylase [Thermoguttaceae bacterium]|jgi:polysaccharide deacetylase family protein (PEP-CTERM system associated)